ncbi:Aldose reductase A [Fusarium oxysporum f. sp. albedinis]|nr:Aldose reductase A [Fusarium oxysporum f. sp. albedinis]
MLRPRRRAVAPLVLLFYPHSFKAEDPTFHQALIVGPPSPLGKRSVGASRLIDRHFTSADSQISDFRFRFSVFSHHSASHRNKNTQPISTSAAKTHVDHEPNR